MPVGSPVPENAAELAGMSDEAVAAKTGRTWAEWVRALDEIGAVEMEHRDIARWVGERVETGWWAQTVTVGYERIRGLRDIGQRRGGLYEANKSRTVAVPVARLYDAFADADLRARWLDEPVTVRTATPHRSVRMTWADDTSVEAYFTDKGPSKSAVQVQHVKLPSKDAAEEAKRRWSECLDRLQNLLDSLHPEAS